VRGRVAQEKFACALLASIVIGLSRAELKHETQFEIPDRNRFTALDSWRSHFTCPRNFRTFFSLLHL
jgi:hypothetical protein